MLRQDRATFFTSFEVSDEDVAAFNAANPPPTAPPDEPKKTPKKRAPAKRKPKVWRKAV